MTIHSSDNPDTNNLATPAHTPQLEAFTQVVEQRRSVRRFTETAIPDEVMNECLRLAMLAPSSSNLQPWGFYIIESEDIRTKANKICMNQNAARTANKLIAIVAHTNNWQQNIKKILADYPIKPVPKKVKEYYTKVVPLDLARGPMNVLSPAKWGATTAMRRFKGPTKSPYYTADDVKNWACINASLAAQNLMLALRAHGFDSCPMMGFDEPAMRKLLRLESGQYIVMMIGAGERADNGIYHAQFRFEPESMIQRI